MIKNKVYGHSFDVLNYYVIEEICNLWKEPFPAWTGNKSEMS